MASLVSVGRPAGHDALRVHTDTSTYTHPPVPDFVHPGDDRLYPDIPNVVSQVFYTHGDVEALHGQTG